MSQLEPAFLRALLGGALIGLASLLASGATGKIPGISGMFSRMLGSKTNDTTWRIVFLASLVAGSALAFVTSDSAAVYRPVRSLTAVAIAGVLVGLGTRLGGGCTSGHGVCGLGLGSKEALVATLVFMATGIGTVWLVNHFAGAALP